jgi:hypothetical protein
MTMLKQGGVVSETAPNEEGHLSHHGYGIPVVSKVADRSGVIWDIGTVAWFEITFEPGATSTSTDRTHPVASAVRPEPTWE